MIGTLTLIGVAMVGSLFSMDAWNNITFTAAEVKRPGRDLPLSLVLGTGIVISLYMLANLAYLRVLPILGDPHGSHGNRHGALSMPPMGAWLRPFWKDSLDRAAPSSWPPPS